MPKKDSTTASRSGKSQKSLKAQIRGSKYQDMAIVKAPDQEYDFDRPAVKAMAERRRLRLSGSQNTEHNAQIRASEYQDMAMVREPDPEPFSGKTAGIRERRLKGSGSVIFGSKDSTKARIIIKVIAWIVGIISFLSIIISSSYGFRMMGIPTYIYYDEPVLVENYDYTYLKEGSPTTIAISFFILSVMLASRIGMAVSSKHWRGGFSAKEELDFKAWMLGVISYGLLGLLIDTIFGYESGWHQIIANFLDLVSIVVIFCIFRAWRNAKIGTY